VKLLVDTNVLISGTFWTGKPAELLNAIQCGKASLICSTPLMAEFADVVWREQFKAQLAEHKTTAPELISQYSQNVAMVGAADIPMPPELRDPKDLMVLAAAVGGEADAIVTGDQDLQALREFRGIPIMEVSEVLAKLP